MDIYFILGQGISLSEPPSTHHEILWDLLTPLFFHPVEVLLSMGSDLRAGPTLDQVCNGLPIFSVSQEGAFKDLVLLHGPPTIGHYGHLVLALGA
jgi:hypothetical protein